MTVRTRAELQARAEIIRSEQRSGANTADRVGGAIRDIADSMAMGGPPGVWVLRSIYPYGSGDTGLTFQAASGPTQIPLFGGLEFPELQQAGSGIRLRYWMLPVSYTSFRFCMYNGSSYHDVAVEMDYGAGNYPCALLEATMERSGNSGIVALTLRATTLYDNPAGVCLGAFATPNWTMPDGCPDIRIVSGTYPASFRVRAATLETRAGLVE